VREGYVPNLSSVEVNLWSYTSTSSVCLHVVVDRASYSFSALTDKGCVSGVNVSYDTEQ
jgi:hypothetical protein